MSKLIVAAAMQAVRVALRNTPGVFAAISIAAGVAAHEAHAQSNEYENLGRSVGSNLGAAVGGNSFSPGSRIAQALGSVAGSLVGRPMDASTNAQKHDAQIAQEAHDLAVRDAAYCNERKRNDPSIDLQTCYADLAKRARAESNWNQGIASNIQALNARNAAIVREMEQRGNAQTAR
jgi:hypothetical protein